MTLPKLTHLIHFNNEEQILDFHISRVSQRYLYVLSTKGGQFLSLIDLDSPQTQGSNFISKIAEQRIDLGDSSLSSFCQNLECLQDQQEKPGDQSKSFELFFLSRDLKKMYSLFPVIPRNRVTLSLSGFDQLYGRIRQFYEQSQREDSKNELQALQLYLEQSKKTVKHSQLCLLQMN